MRFENKEKLSPRFIDPYEILERVGVVAYRIALPPILADVHNVFHLSMLQKYTSYPTHVIEKICLTRKELAEFWLETLGDCATKLFS